ncbi:hypothetical protein [Fimbriiglobus ruber]|uniref:Lipoprotein n=1 Tax=Fimbriiglobus ruber TaxID=1908690 RepID=A0A225DJG3_9BACT|nr:hypothetical protein [Fimbriiglobus ruber]OWK41600.1 hypothetical protein FRUB_03678 [Fimbriiglobus ruber]
MATVHMRSVARAAVGGLFLALVAGCGSSDGRGVKLAPVTGRVVFKNEGVTAATIFLQPDVEKGNQGEMASAILQLDGSFKMETPRGEGVVPGAYKITLDLGRRPEKELLPYRNVKTTPLTVDVPEGGLSDYLIELK